MGKDNKKLINYVNLLPRGNPIASHTVSQTVLLVFVMLLPFIISTIIPDAPEVVMKVMKIVCTIGSIVIAIVNLMFYRALFKCKKVTDMIAEKYQMDRKTAKEIAYQAFSYYCMKDNNMIWYIEISDTEVFNSQTGKIARKKEKNGSVFGEETNLPYEHYKIFKEAAKAFEKTLE